MPYSDAVEAAVAQLLNGFPQDLPAQVRRWRAEVACGYGLPAMLLCRPRWLTYYMFYVVLRKPLLESCLLSSTSGSVSFGVSCG